MQHQLTKYETARILGARALQIAMNAPLLIKISKEDLEKINFDSLKIAELELKSGILPISINKPFPKKREDKLKRVQVRPMSDEEKERLEEEDEKDIEMDGEIMELANPDDEKDDFEEDRGDIE